MTIIEDFLGGKGGRKVGYHQSCLQSLYSVYYYFVLLCEAWPQGQKGADLNGVFISKLLSHYRTAVSWLYWYLELTVSCGKPSLPPVCVGQEQHSLSRVHPCSPAHVPQRGTVR